MSQTINEWMYAQIQADIGALQQSIREITQKSERGETGGGLQSFAYAGRPLAATGGMQVDNTQYVDMIFIYDARKSGEGVGAGTGQPVYYDPAIDDWRVFRDDSVVTV